MVVSHAPISLYSTLSLHVALPILRGDTVIDARNHLRPADLRAAGLRWHGLGKAHSDEHAGYGTRADHELPFEPSPGTSHPTDRKSTRLNSSHITISYAVFCLKKKI